MLDQANEHIEALQDAQTRAQKWWHKNLNRRTAFALAVVVILGATFYTLALRPPSDFMPDTIVTVPEGSSLQEVTEVFESERIVRSALWLRAFVTFLGGERTVFAGDYQFKRPISTMQVARRITTGAFGLEPVRVSIPEGATVEEMAILFSRALPNVDQDAFFEKGRELEGYLFPDTYFFLPNANEDIVLQAMFDNFEQHFSEIESVFLAFGKPLDDIVIMASLLEKEASIFEDKRTIAGVLWNRLEIDMALQVDATFVYFLGKNTFDLTLDDLQVDSPYNTYRYKGLPPGAIANPGLASLKAAITPVEHDFFFYLADFDGVTHFSETFEQHLVKKRKYLD